MNGWPAARIGEAFQALASASGWDCELEREEAESTYPAIEHHLRALAPALLYLPHCGEYVALLRVRKSVATIIGPDRQQSSVPVGMIRAALCEGLESPHRADIERLLKDAAVPASRCERARAALLRERIGSEPIRGLILLRISPAAPFFVQLRHAGLVLRVFALAGLQALQYALWIAAWWVIGAAAFSGKFQPAWFTAWALLLFTLVPCRLMITWLQGAIAIRAGAALKQRLFYGALHLLPDSIRHQGVGQLLGRVAESEVVESMALSGGFAALLSIIELCLSAVVLSWGAAPLIHVAGLLLLLSAMAAVAANYCANFRRWTLARLASTHDLVENMVGHRTRLAQQAPALWHIEEDGLLLDYLAQSQRLDRMAAALAIVPRGWLVISLLGLLPLAARAPIAPTSIAITIGGILLAYRALRRLANGFAEVAGALIAWEQVAPLFRSKARTTQVLQANDKDSDFVARADRLTFRYPGRDAPVLDQCSMALRRGDRVVLEGPSGGGKSTFVSILTGMRQPQSGTLRIGRAGQTWLSSVTAAPQFHENYVLADTFAFNLLMARNRVPNAADLREAATLASELGLEALLCRMPSGMLQLVGESGWQLSHGERSRLFIARALLQGSDLIILDESFAALDPENLKLVMQCVVKHAPSLLVVAHR